MTCCCVVDWWLDFGLLGWLGAVEVLEGDLDKVRTEGT